MAIDNEEETALARQDDTDNEVTIEQSSMKIKDLDILQKKMDKVAQLERKYARLAR